MNKYLITIDLDGTLMLDFNNYDEETFAYVRSLKDKGHKIVIATGRPFRSSYFVYQALGLDTPLINYNGAYITNPNDSTYPVTDVRIDKQDLFDVIKTLGDGLINVFCEIHDDIFVQKYNDSIHDFLHLDGGVLHEGRLEDILLDDPHGALLFVKDEYVNKIEEHINAFANGRIMSRYWRVGDFDIVEIYHPHVDKSQGMFQVAKYYGIPTSHIIAIGDGHNDIGMVEKAAHGVAMSNAHPLVKRIAKNHTTSFQQQGVLKFLKEFFK